METIIVTGATGSMGRVAVRKLAMEGKRVIMACRNLEKAKEVLDAIRASAEYEGKPVPLPVRLDLSSRSSVRNFVAEVEKILDGEKLAGLFNNAGVLSRDYVIAEDGFERTMSVNYLNTALLTRLLLPLFKDDANITCMVSLTTKFASLDTGWPSYPASEYGQLKTYAKSKLALLYFAAGLARRFPRLHVNVADPGVVNSNMIKMDRWFDPIADVVFRPLISSPEKGVAPALAAMHSDKSMLYFVGRKSSAIAEKYTSSPLVDALWEQATEQLGL